MFENPLSNDEILQKVVLFEDMLSENHLLFDVEDYENIIDYYIDLELHEKVNAALDFD